MPQRFVDIVRSMVPLSRQKESFISELPAFLEKEDVAEVRSLVKQKKIDIIMDRARSTVADPGPYPVLECKITDQKVKDWIVRLNSIILEKSQQKSYETFCAGAALAIPKLIAPNIVGMDVVKHAVALQLFTTPAEPVHILLLGDPGTGKTDILRSAATLHKISSLGLGSGTSGVGLTVTMKGEEVAKGLLPMADKGLCAIDELNLMQERDRASLYNAMEKGFISYDKGGRHFKFDARVKVIASANPKGDSFSATDLAGLRTQLPFDSALLTRFHLVFFIRKPDIADFVEISKKIVKNAKRITTEADEEFVRGYAAYSEDIEVRVPDRLQQDIVDFVAEIKKGETSYLVEVSPRLVIGFMRLAKASARMRLASEVSQEDVGIVKELVKASLSIDKYK
jgi:replicative DNA helicase Mcm